MPSTITLLDGFVDLSDQLQTAPNYKLSYPEKHFQALVGKDCQEWVCVGAKVGPVGLPEVCVTLYANFLIYLLVYFSA